jgi:hypothetical protein
MDEQDGIDLLEELNSLAPNTRSILMSAHATAKDHKRAMDLGAVQVLCKPFSSNELLQAIQQAIECESGFRGSVHGLSLIDVLQMFHYARRSISISIAGGVHAEIHLRDGEVVHAVCGQARGEAALQRILAMPSGAIVTSALSTAEVSVTRPFQSLLLDVLREVDESGRDAAGGSVHDPFGFGDDWLSLDSTPPPESLGPPRSGPALTEACRAAVHAVPSALACAVFAVEDGSVLGAYSVAGGSIEPAVLGESAAFLVRSAALKRLDALVASNGGAPEAPTSVRDLRISSPREFRFVRVLPGGRHAVLLVASREMNPGLGWAQFRALLPAIEARVP